MKKISKENKAGLFLLLAFFALAFCHSWIQAQDAEERRNVECLE